MSIKEQFLKCEVCTNVHEKFEQMNFGNLSTAKLMVIGQSPSFPVHAESYPFDWTNVLTEAQRRVVGLIDNAFEKAPIRKNECYVTNAIKCGAKELSSVNFENCKAFLFDEIKQFRGKFILILGKFIADSLKLPMEKLVSFMNKKVYCINHPSYFARSGNAEGFLLRMKNFFKDLDIRHNLDAYVETQQDVLGFRIASFVKQNDTGDGVLITKILQQFKLSLSAGKEILTDLEMKSKMYKTKPNYYAVF